MADIEDVIEELVHFDGDFYKHIYPHRELLLDDGSNATGPEVFNFLGSGTAHTVTVYYPGCAESGSVSEETGQAVAGIEFEISLTDMDTTSRYLYVHLYSNYGGSGCVFNIDFEFTDGNPVNITMTNGASVSGNVVLTNDTKVRYKIIRSFSSVLIFEDDMTTPIYTRTISDSSFWADYTYKVEFEKTDTLDQEFIMTDLILYGNKYDNRRPSVTISSTNIVSSGANGQKLQFTITYDENNDHWDTWLTNYLKSVETGYHSINYEISKYEDFNDILKSDEITFFENNGSATFDVDISGLPAGTLYLRVKAEDWGSVDDYILNGSDDLSSSMWSEWATTSFTNDTKDATHYIESDEEYGELPEFNLLLEDNFDKKHDYNTSLYTLTNCEYGDGKLIIGASGSALFYPPNVTGDADYFNNFIHIFKVSSNEYDAANPYFLTVRYTINTTHYYVKVKMDELKLDDGTTVNNYDWELNPFKPVTIMVIRNDDLLKVYADNKFIGEMTITSDTLEYITFINDSVNTSTLIYLDTNKIYVNKDINKKTVLDSFSLSGPITTPEIKISDFFDGTLGSVNLTRDDWDETDYGTSFIIRFYDTNYNLYKSYDVDLKDDDKEVITIDFTGDYYVSLQVKDDGHYLTNGFPYGSDRLWSDELISTNTISVQPYYIKLSVTSTIYNNNTYVTLSAIDSNNEEFKADKYRFHFGDEKNSGWITESHVDYVYSTTGVKNAYVEAYINDVYVKSTTANIHSTELSPTAIMTTSHTVVPPKTPVKISLENSIPNMDDIPIYRYYYTIVGETNKEHPLINQWIPNDYIYLIFDETGEYYVKGKVKTTSGTESDYTDVIKITVTDSMILSDGSEISMSATPIVLSKKPSEISKSITSEYTRSYANATDQPFVKSDNKIKTEIKVRGLFFSDTDGLNDYLTMKSYAENKTYVSLEFINQSGTIETVTGFITNLTVKEVGGRVNERMWEATIVSYDNSGYVENVLGTNQFDKIWYVGKVNETLFSEMIMSQLGLIHDKARLYFALPAEYSFSDTTLTNKWLPCVGYYDLLTGTFGDMIYINPQSTYQNKSNIVRMVLGYNNEKNITLYGLYHHEDDSVDEYPLLQHIINTYDNSYADSVIVDPSSAYDVLDFDYFKTRNNSDELIYIDNDGTYYRIVRYDDTVLQLVSDEFDNITVFSLSTDFSNSTDFSTYGEDDYVIVIHENDGHLKYVGYIASDRSTTQVYTTLTSYDDYAAKVITGGYQRFLNNMKNLDYDVLINNETLFITSMVSLKYYSNVAYSTEEKLSYVSDISSSGITLTDICTLSNDNEYSHGVTIDYNDQTYTYNTYKTNIIYDKVITKITSKTGSKSTDLNNGTEENVYTSKVKRLSYPFPIIKHYHGSNLGYNFYYILTDEYDVFLAMDKVNNVPCEYLISDFTNPVDSTEGVWSLQSGALLAEKSKIYTTSNGTLTTQGCDLNKTIDADNVELNLFVDFDTGVNDDDGFDIIVYGNESGFKISYRYLASDNRYYLRINDSAAVEQIISGRYHIKVVLNDGSGKIYHNGTEIWSIDTSSSYTGNYITLDVAPNVKIDFISLGESDDS